MQYEWLHSHALTHVQTINQRIIYHSKPSSVIQLHVQQTNHRIQIKVWTCLLHLLKMISSSVYKQAMISTPIQTILFIEAYRSRWRPILCDYGDPITSRTRWPAFIGCASLRESSSRLPSWPTESCTDTRRGTSALSHSSPTYLVAGRCALSAPTAWQCLLPDCRLLAAELFRLSAHRLGTTCRKTWRQQIHSLLFVAFTRHTCSENPFRTICWT